MPRRQSYRKYGSLVVLAILVTGVFALGDLPGERRFRPRRHCNTAQELDGVHADLAAESVAAELYRLPAGWNPQADHAKWDGEGYGVVRGTAPLPGPHGNQHWSGLRLYFCPPPNTPPFLNAIPRAPPTA